MKKPSLLLVWCGVAVVAAVGGLLLIPRPGRPTPAFAPTSVKERTLAAVSASALLHDDEVDAAEKRPDRNTEPEKTGFRERIEAALQISDAAKRQSVLASVLAKWLRIDPAGFAKYVMLLEVQDDTSKLDQLANALNRALAELDAAAASSEAVKEPVRRLILHLARVDPDAALDLANTWLVGDTREAVSVSIARVFAQRDPQEGLALASRLASPLRRMQALAAVGGVWARAEPSAALTWASRISTPTERAMALNAVVTALAHDDPQTAAVRLASAARLMADEYHERYQRDLATLNLSEADLANDPEKYTEMLEAGEIPPPTSSDVELMSDAARVVARKLALGRPREAVAWAESLENDFLWLHAVTGAAAGWSQADPAAAADYVSGKHPQYPELVTAVYEVWADSAPAQAAAGTGRITEPGLRRVAVETVAQAWTVSDPVAAAAWADRLPVAERTDQVQLAVVSGLSQVDPINAWSRAQSIQDPSLQYRGLKAAFSTIVIQQPHAARDLLAAATLTVTAAERLRALLDAGAEG